MPNTRYQRDYFCTRCGKKTDREKLTVKKAVFTEVGSRAKTFRSRVMRTLCPNCLKTDEDWNKEAYAEPDFEVMPEGFDDPSDNQPEPNPDPDQLELPLEPAHLLQAPADFRDHEGRPPGHPQYCGEGCIHVEDVPAR